ncbi:hypothetical protein Pelo_18898 [Pelomyxa schiedti]|nr:hypothetical protein Pelo_18898 [Pelomyxa schiedti]
MVFRVVGGGGGESTGASRAVYLNCGHCRFSTAESGLVAANPEELMNEIMLREDIPELRTAFTQTSELCIGKSFTEAEELHRGSRHLGPPITFDDLNEKIARKREDLAKPSRADYYIINPAPPSIIAQSDPTDCLTLEQKLNHGSRRKLLPQRMLLRSTRTKLCPSCKSVLVKPSIGDNKPPSRQHFAWNYLPHITISQVKFTTDTSISATLIFSNTSPRLLQVSACSGKLNKSASLAIESRSFSLDADDPTPTVAACHSSKRVCLPACIELHSLNKLGYMVSVDLEVNFELTFKQNAPVQQQPQIFRIPQAVKTTYLLKFKIDNRN